MTTRTLDSAMAKLAREREHAQTIGVPMNIAVTDGGRHLLGFARMDGSILGSIDIALTKAKTSILFNRPSENLREFCKPEHGDGRGYAVARNRSSLL
jgi:uncharacterized protein GlcG (DUF336 family)